MLMILTPKPRINTNIQSWTNILLPVLREHHGVIDFEDLAVFWPSVTIYAHRNAQWQLQLISGGPCIDRASQCLSIPHAHSVDYHRLSWRTEEKLSILFYDSANNVKNYPSFILFSWPYCIHLFIFLPIC